MSNKTEYAVVNDGLDYRTIASKMSQLGQPMNHGSVRNNVVKTMSKFVVAIARRHNINLTPSEVTAIAKSAQFQNAFGELITRLL